MTDASSPYRAADAAGDVWQDNSEAKRRRTGGGAPCLRLVANPVVHDHDTAAALAATTTADDPVEPRSAEALSDGDFAAALAATGPQLRAFGRSLSGNADVADDLVQETMLKAWLVRDRFVAGSNMRAWTHVILRNVYFSQVRRARFKGEWDDFSAELLLAVPAGQESHVALNDMQRALRQLPFEQREALLLMGAGGMTCAEVAAISRCATGTVKSRVARGRAALRALLQGGQLQECRADGPTAALPAFDDIMQQAQRLAAPGRRAPAGAALSA